ncbi:MAG TPA: RNA polymerase sigma-70 factor [Fodinibius sp.]|nr:RNA polymerase sigma-70 factor [Fodinibius sp.]
MGSPEKKKIARWARKIKAGDETAFSRLFHHLHPRLVKFSWRYTQTQASAQDVVQESFVRLWQKRSAIDPEQSLLSYLYQIVRNRSLNYLRDHSSDTLAISELPEHALQSHDYIPSLVSADDELSARMLLLIDQLPSRRREALRLSRFEGLDHDEIAYVMGVSSRTVNNHIVAAVKTLREQWNEYKKNHNRITEL